ncbi:MAG: multidrug efflux transporter [Oerskovia sp.]|nr:multidrug efflux transporter [Oerskovia sp.]
MIGTVQQLAGAAGTALFIAVMTSHEVARAAEGASPQVALADGVSSAFVWGAVVMLVAVALSFLLRKPAVVEAPAVLSDDVAPLAQDAPVLEAAGEAADRR